MEVKVSKQQILKFLTNLVEDVAVVKDDTLCIGDKFSFSPTSIVSAEYNNEYVTFTVDTCKPCKHEKAMTDMLGDENAVYSDCDCKH